MSWKERAIPVNSASWKDRAVSVENPDDPRTPMEKLSSSIADSIKNNVAPNVEAFKYNLGNPLGVTKNVAAPAVQALAEQLAEGDGPDVDKILLDQGFTGDLAAKKSLLDKYRDAKVDIGKKYDDMDKAHPVASFLGSLGSNALLPLGAAGSAETLGAKVLEGVGSGAKFGAGLGAIGSKADLTQIMDHPEQFPAEIVKLAKDTLLNSAGGAVLGGAAPLAIEGAKSAVDLVGKGVKSAADLAMDTIPPIKQAVDAGVLASQGNSIVGNAAKKDIQEGIANKSEELVNGLNDNLSKFGKAKGDVLEKANVAGNSIDASDDINKMLDMVNNIPGKNKNIKSDRDSLRNLLQEYKSGSQNMNPTDLDQAYKDVYDLAQKAESGLSTKTAGDISKGFKDLTNKALGNLAPELDTANKGYSKTKEALSILDPKLSSMNGVDKAEAKNALNGFLENMESAGRGGDTAQKTFGSFMERFKETNPELAEKIGPELQTLAQRFDLNKESSKTGLIHLGTIKGLGIRGGAAIGSGINTANKIVSAGKSYLTNNTPEAITDMAGKLAQSGETKYSSLLNNIANKPERTRSALIFSLMQRPEFRQLISGDKNDEQP